MKQLPFYFGKTITAGLIVLSFFLAMRQGYAERPYYQASTWQPRALLPTDDALKGNFWPASPPVKVTYDDPGFDEERLAQVPPPGVHPRVLLTPSDVEKIRAKVALGEQAPLPFRVMWQRVTKSRSAFYALVSQDEALGKELAAQLYGKLKTLEPKLDKIDAQPDHDNIWMLERSIIASGDPDPPTEIWDLLDYDYLSGWMTPDQREEFRQVIARLTTHRISNFMMVPDHFMINNHQGFGLEYLRLLLLIEGEKGFDEAIFRLGAQKARAMLNWYLDDDGMCYESIKGWLNVSAFVGVGLRERDLLRHDHLRAKMHFFQAAIRWEDGSWKIRDEMRASAFHVIWMMHYYHPKDQGLDFLYRATLTTHLFLTDPEAKWPGPVGISPELLLLYADDGLAGPDGRPLDWTEQARIDSLHLPLTWQDNQRGYVDTRNSWRKDDLHLGFVCKQDFFYGGHEGSENNRLTLWANGVNWIQDTNMLATKATFLQNMLTIDGKGCHWPPAPGTWLGVRESTAGVSAVGDGKDGYSYTKSMQIHPLDFPSGKLDYYAPFLEGNYDLSRDLQVAFNPRTVAWNNGYAHTDYGPWSGETRLVENYRSWNPMEQAFRTVLMARGNNPYVLVLDDARKDGQTHNFDWNITVPVDAELVDVATPEIVFQNTEPSGLREDDLLLAKGGTPRDPKTGKLTPKKGDPLFLIRVLWRNTDYGFPTPRLEHFQGFSHVTIPAHSSSPEFRILLYPHLSGDPLPKTAWNRDRSELTVQLKDQIDHYHLAQSDGGRTVFTMERAGQIVLTSNAPPSRPILLVRGKKFDLSDYRYTQVENKAPEYLVDDRLEVSFVHPQAGSTIHYTLDGSDPTETSPVYGAPILVQKTCLLKARTVDPHWEYGPIQSEILSANFTLRQPAPGQAEAPVESKPGLLARVYELKTVLWDDHGFFDANKIMLPRLSPEKPLLTRATDGFVLPICTPAQPQEHQDKGFYRFTGLFYARERGVYQFAVNSCGPVTLDFGNQAAIESIGVFHQQQAIRSGEAVLEKGWHPMELVICDPLFWNINSLEPMPLSVSYQVNGKPNQSLTDSELRFVTSPDATPTPAPEPTWHDALLHLPLLEPGLDWQVFDRTGLGRTPNFLDIDGLNPIQAERVDHLTDNDSRNAVYCYTGYFHAPTTGLYQFNLPTRHGENAGLGALRASSQNQLRIDDEIAVQHGVPGRNPPGQVALKEGWHTLSIRMGAAVAEGSVLFPNGEIAPLNGQELSRPVLVSISPEGALTQRSQYEIYAPTKVSLTLPKPNQATIHYTLDGSAPDAHSPTYTEPFVVDKTAVLTAVAFQGSKAITAPAKMSLSLVNVPQIGCLGQINFAQWNGQTGPMDSPPTFGAWVAPGSHPAQGREGKALLVNPSHEASEALPKVDVNVAHRSIKAGLKLHHIKMRENALTVAIWLKTSELTGKLFGKDGYNAFGKSYKTFSCDLNNGELHASPGHLSGGKLTANTWQFVVLSADEQAMGMYLNGQPVATGPGTHDLTTDALDFFVGLSAAVDQIQIYDRRLEPSEVQHLFTQGSHSSP